MQTTEMITIGNHTWKITLTEDHQVSIAYSLPQIWSTWRNDPLWQSWDLDDPSPDEEWVTQIRHTTEPVTVHHRGKTTLHPFSSKSFLGAHKLLMNELIDKPGKYRSHGAGIFQGAKMAHIAPPARNVPHLMDDLFSNIKNEDELTLIKSCVFHYEMEFIHPFTDGNGRMGRLWQTVILMKEYPVFEFLPFETLISQTQQEYYNALAQSDKAGKSTLFIEYMLDVIDKSLNELLRYNNRILKDTDRLNYFLSMGKNEFTRKDYMNVFKDISPATASRDLKKGVELNLFNKTGNKNRTVYKLADKQ